MDAHISCCAFNVPVENIIPWRHDSSSITSDLSL